MKTNIAVITTSLLWCTLPILKIANDLGYNTPIQVNIHPLVLCSIGLLCAMAIVWRSVVSKSLQSKSNV